MTASFVYAAVRTPYRWGVAAICIGVGVGQALTVVLENVQVEVP